MFPCFRVFVFLCARFVPQKILNFLLGVYTNIYNKLKYRIAQMKQLSIRRRKEDIEKKIVLGVFKKRRFPRFAQLVYLPRFLSKKEAAVLFIFGGLMFFGFFGIVISSYLNNTKIIPAAGGEYIEGVVGYPRFINPLYSQSNEVDRDLTVLVYSGLAGRNTRGASALDLAKEYKLSDDEKTYTFILRNDVKWSDGKPFTADDVVFTIETIKNDKYLSPLRTAWLNIGIKKIDDSAVQFQLDKPYAPFLTLASAGILPKHIWEKVPVASINLADANTKPVGTGPYVFKSFVKDKAGVIKSYTLDRNENYYGAKPNIKRVTLKFYPDYISAANALDNRQIDGLAFVPAEARSVLKLRSRLESYDIALPQFNAVFFNSRENEILKDKAVRKALALAIDRKRIIGEALDGDGVLIEGPILPGYPGYNDKLGRLYTDKEAAQKLLVDAGWVLKDGNNIRTNKKNAQLKIELTTIDKEQNIKAANIIKENWESAGVTVNLKVVAAGNVSKEVIDVRKYQAFLFGEMYGPELDPYSYWHTSALRYPGLNLAQYSNSKIDTLLEAARQTSDKVVRQKKYEEFQSLLMEDFPTIFLWQPKYTYLIDKKVRGLEISTLLTPLDRWRSIMAGYINTKRALK